MDSKSRSKWLIILTTLLILVACVTILLQTNILKNLAPIFYNNRDLGILKEISRLNNLDQNVLLSGTRWKQSRLIYLAVDDKIKILPESLTGLDALNELYVSNRAFTELPKSFFELKNLESLVINGTAIREVPQALGKLTHLKSLTITRNTALESITDAINFLRELENLIITDNKVLQKLPDSLNNLTRLQKLSIIQDAIDRVPAGLAALSELTTLEMFLSSSTSHPIAFPEDLTALSKLTRLALTGNFEKLPSGMDKLSNLRELYFDGLPVKVFPEAVYNLKLCEYLVFSDCQLTILPDGISRLKNLHTLILSINKLRALPADLYTMNGALKVEIQNNYLHDVTPQQDAWLKAHAGADWRTQQNE